MKKILLIMALALTAGFNAHAQEEGEEVTTPIHKGVLTVTLNDAKSLVADSHYTQGQDDLLAAIATAEAAFEGLADDVAVREATIALRRAIDHFVYFNDHVDATDRIENPTFNKDGNNSKTVTSWTVTNFKQNRRSVSYPTTRINEEGIEMSMTDFVEQWVNATALTGSGDINQTINNLPAGHYRLTADCFVVSQKDANVEEATGAQLYANDTAIDLAMTDVLDGVNAAAFSIDVDIAEGEALTIGFRYADLNVNWLGWDNVTLIFVGNPDDYNSIVNAEKIAAAREALQASLNAANEALGKAEELPLGRPDLQTAIEAATAELESNELDALEVAKSNLDAALKDFNGYNKYFSNLQKAIANAEALIAAGELTNEVEAFQEAINQAKEDIATSLQYADSPTEAIVVLEEGLEDLQKAEATFRIANACYSNPANVITNGDMASTNGWEILVPGANPGLHINTSGNVEGFSKPFMECWVKSTSTEIGNYGQENYAKQTVSALPDGQPLPKGYYVLKAAVVATQQGDTSAEVNGVSLKLEDEEVAVSTGNGVSKTYLLGYDKQEVGGELTIGLYIDAETNANWIAWDEVELQFVGDKDKYLEEYGIAVLGESLTKLKEAVADANALMESVDPNGIDIESTDLFSVVDEAQYIIDHPTDKDATKEYIDQLLEEIASTKAAFYTSGVSPKDGESFDYSSFIKNGEFDTAPTAEEWTPMEPADGSEAILPSGTDCVTWWFGSSFTGSLTQEFQQTIPDMPTGNYLLEVQAAIRVDMTYSVNNYTEENLSKYLTSFKAYANTDSADIHPFFYEDEAKGLTLESMMAMTNDYDYRHGNGTLTDMLKSGLFRTFVPFTMSEEGDITVGLRLELPTKNGQQPTIDYFRLRYFGNQEVDIDRYTGIAATAVEGQKSTAIYNLSGQRVVKPTKGLYIVNGRKVVVK